MHLTAKIKHRIFHEPHPFELFSPALSPESALIVMTPLLGRLVFLDDLQLERFFARRLASAGFHTALIHRPFFSYLPERGLEQIADYMEDAVSRNEAIYQSLLKTGSFSPERTGTFGISFGAIVNALWAGRQKQLSAHVFALAGGNLPEIFVTSRDPLMRQYLKETCRLSGKDPGTLRRELKEVFRFDPLDAAAAVDRKSVLMVIALLDRIVRTRFGLALRKALGNPETVFLPFGHVFSILAAPLLLNRALNFYHRRFDRLSPQNR